MFDFTYYNPTKVLFGKGVNGKIADEIARDGVSGVLLLYGGGSIHRTGVYEAVTEGLRRCGVRFAECPGVKANPVLSKAREAVAAVRAEKLGAILAVGGGSVIDCAKGVAAGALYDGDLWDFYERRAKLERALPVYAVATVSATASEMNYTSVMTNEALGLKVGLGHDLLYPRCTAIDPSVQATVSERQTVDGGIDAVCHVMETYFDGTMAGVELQMEYCEGLIRSIMRLVPILRERPGDYDARSQFAWASVNALNGTTWAGHPGRGDFASHAIGHALSARYDSIHGETLAAVMPAWMRYVCADNPAPFARFAERVFDARGGSEADLATQGIDGIRAWFASLGAPTTLRALGVPEGDLPELAATVTRNGPVGVFRKLAGEDVLKIYQAAF